jgi:hypothetical protein
MDIEQDVSEELALVNSMARSPDPEVCRQAAQIRSQIGKAPRVRPEEVAGACLEEPLPASGVDFVQCEENGRKVLEVCDSARGKPSM